ncbi:MAG: hypothetical protein JXL97_05235 [Bacteroidales bacterium]|nr:hypothetical protein [Bacteroidales bacterium]
MKKTISLFIILFLAIGFISAQNNQADIDALTKQIEKSDKDITNPKKSAKLATWSKRGKLFIEAYSVNFKYLAPGIHANSLSLLGISESSPQPYYGKPLKTYEEDKLTVWEYRNIKIYISSDVLVDHWVETNIAFPGALDKSYEAYKKALELDVDEKYRNKKSTMQELSALREHLMNRAVEAFYNNESAPALADLEKCMDLYQYPKTEDDTIVTLGAYSYYAAIFAYNGKKELIELKDIYIIDDNTSDSLKKVWNKQNAENEAFNKEAKSKNDVTQKYNDEQCKIAKKYFAKAIEEEYEIGTSYQYLAQVMFELNDTLNAVKKLEEGLKKYPQEEKLIYSLIDYYTPRGEYEKAFEYIDKAIAMNDTLAVLYIVKGNSYAKIMEDKEDAYYAKLTEADDLDKEAFKNRNTPKEKEFNDKRDNILNNEIPKLEQEIDEFSQKALDAYNLGIENDNKNADYYYTVAFFYYKKAVKSQTYASSIRKLKDIITKLDTKGTEYLESAKEYAEQAYKINPKDVYTLDLLAKIYYRLKMYDESAAKKLEIENL